MAYVSTHPLFRSLTDAEEASFRAHARANPPPAGAWDVLHPVCRDEWIKLGHPDTPDRHRIPDWPPAAR